MQKEDGAPCLKIKNFQDGHSRALNQIQGPSERGWDPVRLHRLEAPGEGRL